MVRQRREILKWLAGAGALLLTGCQQSPTPPSSRTRYIVYLTSDDGPLRGSENVLKVVEHKGVPLWAFVVGRNSRPPSLKARLDAYRRSSYITLANHSYSHAKGHYSSYYHDPLGGLEDFEHNRKALGLQGKEGRLPGRNSWRVGGRAYDVNHSARAAADLLAKHGYTLYGWDLEWTHTASGAPIGSAEILYRKIRHQLEKGHLFTPGHLVLLMHDQMFRSRGAAAQLDKLISMLQKDPEIELAPLTRYPRMAVEIPRAPVKGPHLIKAPGTGVGEETPVDPLKFGQ